MTKIATLKGTKELPFTVIQMPVEMSLTRFFGGTKRGIMLKMRIGNEYVDLTEREINHLKKILNSWKTSEIDLH